MARILSVDIETRPALVWTFDLKTRYIPPDHIREAKRMLCVAAKFRDEEEMYFFSEWDDGREEMARGIWELLDSADIVLGYNSRRFDVPALMTEFLLAGLPPPSPFAQIDLYLAVRKKFSFMSNSLKHVSKMIGTANKLENEGFKLWTDVIDGDEEARRKMQEYNQQDVECNLDLFERILPWIPSMPSIAVIDGNGASCPGCGSARMIRQGLAYTATATYQRWQCRECRRWSRSARQVAGSDLRAVA
jgi:DNA polymerase elongation subunit (family B)